MSKSNICIKSSWSWRNFLANKYSLVLYSTCLLVVLTDWGRQRGSAWRPARNAARATVSPWSSPLADRRLILQGKGTRPWTPKPTIQVQHVPAGSRPSDEHIEHVWWALDSEKWRLGHSGREAGLRVKGQGKQGWSHIETGHRSRTHTDTYTWHLNYISNVIHNNHFSKYGSFWKKKSLI